MAVGSVVVGGEAAEPDAHRPVCPVEVGDGQEAAEVFVAGQRVSDDAKPEGIGRLRVDAASGQVPPGAGRNGCLIARCRIFSRFALGGGQRPQRLGRGQSRRPPFHDQGV